MSLASPRIVPLVLPPLTRADDDDLDEGPVWEDLDFTGLDCSGRDLTDAVFTGCDLTAVTWEDTALRGVTITDCRAERLSVTTLRAASSHWRRSVLSGTRIGAAELHGGEWDQCVVSGCKVGYLNLRAASLTDVAFEGCVFDDLDVTEASLTRVEFRDCRAGMVTARGATFADTSLVGLDFAGIDDPSALAGALVSHEQVFELAPVFAARAGLIVED